MIVIIVCLSLSRPQRMKENCRLHLFTKAQISSVCLEDDKAKMSYKPGNCDDYKSLTEFHINVTNQYILTGEEKK